MALCRFCLLTQGAEQGLLSRWSEYAYGDHSGGNKRLKELGVKYIEDNFQYSILEIFDMRALPKDIINRSIGGWTLSVLCTIAKMSIRMDTTLLQSVIATILLSE